MAEQAKPALPDADATGPSTVEANPKVVDLPSAFAPAPGPGPGPAPANEETAPAPAAPSPARGPGAFGRTMRFLGRSTLALVQAVIAIALLAGGYLLAQRMIAAAPEPRKRPPFQAVYTVQTVPAVAADNRPTITAYGQTVAARVVDLRSLVSGEVVSISPNLRAGARVEKGETLLTIDPFDYRGAVTEARANLAEAQARIVEANAQVAAEESRLAAAEEQLVLAETDLQRAERLLSRRTTTQQQVESRRLVVSQRRQAVSQSRDAIAVQKAKLPQLEASLDRLRWRLEQAERNLSSTTLTAPFSGIVRNAAAEVGRTVNASDVVVSLYEEDVLEVRFTLTDAQFGRLAASEEGIVGRALTVVWNVGGRDYEWPARIDRLGAEITAARGGVEVYARVEGGETNGVSLRPGAFVQLRVPDLTYAGSIRVPDTAIYDGDTAYVMVEGKLRRREVTVAAYDGEEAIVTQGLQPGDAVLTTRLTEVSEGLSVRTEAQANAPRAEDAAPAPTGRPDREEIAAIAEANGLTVEAFRALPREERRALVRAHRQGRAKDQSRATGTDG